MTYLKKRLESGVCPFKDRGKDKLGFEETHRLERRLRVGDRERVAGEHGEERDRSHRLDKLVADLGREAPLERRLAVRSFFFLEALVWVRVCVDLEKERVRRTFCRLWYSQVTFCKNRP